MVRPANFGWNQETSHSNRFQVSPEGMESSVIHTEALREFESMRTALEGAGVQVHAFDDDQDPVTPDSIFPNNWVSFHSDGTVILYPMHANNRRAEVRTDWVDNLEKELGIRWSRRVDLRHLCEQDHFLEGTGSMILDRTRKVAYAALSPRTTPEGLKAFAQTLDYKVHAIHTSVEGHPVYHTNVMMSLGQSHAMVCLQSIPDEGERKGLMEQLEATGRQVIEIDRDQMINFAGNQLTLASTSGDPLIVMSKRALASLRPSQVRELEGHGQVIAPCLMTIEHHGGGSARCMLAEIATPA
ncbi:MAG: arginine deiminase-related protein [Planctomycetota bacterium]|nr:arginine deiminase-related protein [Planctomycetota bacterium]